MNHPAKNQQPNVEGVISTPSTGKVLTLYRQNASVENMETTQDQPTQQKPEKKAKNPSITLYPESLEQKEAIEQAAASSPQRSMNRWLLDLAMAEIERTEKRRKVS